VCEIGVFRRAGFSRAILAQFPSDAYPNDDDFG
jgi:hypothetical protein